MVMALTARSRGRSDASIFCRSITTDVSTNPRAGRAALGTRSRILRRDAVEIIAEPLGVNARSAPEQGDSGFGTNKAMTTQRRQFSNGTTVARNHEGLAFVKLPHDLAALVAEFSLGDLPTHSATVARRATGTQRPCAADICCA